MTVVNPKSISGINSITTGSGSDNLLTIHTSDANNTERVRVNSSGDVIVGSGVTLSPDGDVFFTGIITGNGSGLTNLATDLVNDTSPQLGGNLDVNTKNIVFGDSGGATDDRLTFGAGTDLSIYHDGTHSQIKDASSGELIISGSVISLNNAASNEYMLKGTENGAVELYHDNTKQFETSANGLAFPSGKGIDFSATADGGANGTMSNELLDDYEEGTFTPSLTNNGGSNMTYNTQQGYYTKIGNVVHVQIYIGINVINANGTGTLLLVGLPFTKTGQYGGLSINYLYGINNTEFTHCLINVNSTQAYLYNWHSSTVSNYYSQTTTVAGALTNATEIILSGTYLAA